MCVVFFISSFCLERRLFSVYMFCKCLWFTDVLLIYFISSFDNSGLLLIIRYLYLIIVLVIQSRYCYIFIYACLLVLCIYIYICMCVYIYIYIFIGVIFIFNVVTWVIIILRRWDKDKFTFVVWFCLIAYTLLFIIFLNGYINSV